MAIGELHFRARHFALDTWQCATRTNSIIIPKRHAMAIFQACNSYRPKVLPICFRFSRKLKSTQPLILLTYNGPNLSWTCLKPSISEDSRRFLTKPWFSNPQLTAHSEAFFWQSVTLQYKYVKLVLKNENTAAEKEVDEPDLVG